MPKLFKKFLLSTLAFLVLFLSFAPSLNIIKAAEPDASATETWYNTTFPAWSKKVNDTSNPSDIFGERYTSAQVQWVIYGLINFLMTTTVPSNVLSCVFSNTVDLKNCQDAISGMFTQPTQPTSPDRRSSIQKPQTLASLVFATDRPISGIGYIKEKISSFKLVPEAKAQTVGFGFNALKPIQEMWKASRNLAYGLFVLTSIIFSFMIMFRVKINPQTVISVQSAIPKVIGALVAVTFSYAIAGFLIDLMYVVIGILSVFLASFMPASTPASWVFSLLTQGNVFGAVGLNIQTGIVTLIMAYLSPLIIALLALTLIIGAASAGLLFWIPLILLIIVIILGLWMSIKTIFALLKAFVNIILLTVFGPLQMALGVLIPNFGLGSWIKSFLSNLSVFVVTGVIYFMSIVFLFQGISIGLNGIFGNIASLFGPLGILISNVTGDYGSFPPLLGSSSPEGIGLLFLGVSFVLFTLIPKATEIVQGFISGKPFAYGSAIGEAFGPVVGYTGSTAEHIARNGTLPWPLNKVEPLNQKVAGLTGEDIERLKTGAGIVSSVLGGDKRRG